MLVSGPALDVTVTCDVIVHIEEIMSEKSIFNICSPTLTTLTYFLMQSNIKYWSAVTSDDDGAIFSSISLILTKL